jgi:Phage capsid family
MKTIREAGALAARAGTARRAGLRPCDYLYRTAVVHLRAGSGDVAAVCKQIYRDDEVTPTLLQRAASAPATVANPGWAGSLAHQVVSDLLQEIVSISAAAALLSKAQQINFDHAQSVRMPSRLTDARYAGQWLAEGAAIPVFQFPTSAVTLVPHKIAVISTFTDEMLASSNIEVFVRSLLSEAVALALDAALFGVQVGDAVTPGGILAGLTAIPASAATTSRRDAMVEDVQSLVQSLANAGGGANATFVAAPAQATALALNASPEFTSAVLASAALPAGTVVCVEPRSLVASIASAVPEFSTAPSAVLMMDDTNPTDVVAGSPTRSMFQLDSLALKMVLRNVDWKMRAAHVAYVEAVNW